MTTRFSGVYAALLTPRDPAGRLNLPSFRTQFSAPAADQLAGYAINGATGEFTLSGADDIARLVSATRAATPAAQILCGIGAGSVAGAIANGQAAAQSGADAVLLPMPCFFPYRQDDLKAFCLAVASELTIPALLYNLPQFTSGLNTETVLELLEHDNIVGIKDSSGSLDIVRAITDADNGAARLIGNDGALCDAMQERLCDGVVSGVACALPELMTSLFATGGESPHFASHKATLNEFIGALDALPTPWGLKVTSAVRGFTQESYPLPLSTERSEEVEALREWFRSWHGKAIEGMTA